MASNPDLLQTLSDLRPGALSRWDNEGGALPVADAAPGDRPDLTNSELVLLRVRVIALENALIAVLAEGSEEQRQAARDMAETIAPHTGSTQHTLTIRAAQHIAGLLDRADHVREAKTRTDGVHN